MVLEDISPETVRKPARKKRRKDREAEAAAAKEIDETATGLLNLAYVPGKDMTLDEFANAFWKHQFDTAETIVEDFKTPELPLARVKRVMKTDPDVAMIASEVPVILEKACQIFISELTARAFIDSTKRRTLTKLDVVLATTRSDMFDFLIDIAPRDTLDPSDLQTQYGEETVKMDLTASTSSRASAGRGLSLDDGKARRRIGKSLQTSDGDGDEEEEE